MIPSWAKPGAKVVCVNKEKKWNICSGDPEDASGIDPQYNEICFIRSIEVFRGVGFLGLEGYTDMYDIRDFRPLIEEKDDIALFTHLLNATSEDQLIKEEA